MDDLIANMKKLKIGTKFEAINPFSMADQVGHIRGDGDHMATIPRENMYLLGMHGLGTKGATYRTSDPGFANRSSVAHVHRTTGT